MSTRSWSARGLRNRVLRGVCRIVGQNAEIGHGGAELAPATGEQSSGWHRRASAGRRAAPGSTISSPVENKRNAHAPPHVDSREPERGGERNIRTPSARARPATRRARADILAGEPAVGAGFEAGRHDHVVCRRVRHIFLHEDGVGALAASARR